jgi:hypothetical protein
MCAWNENSFTHVSGPGVLPRRVLAARNKQLREHTQAGVSRRVTTARTPRSPPALSRQHMDSSRSIAGARTDAPCVPRTRRVSCATRPPTHPAGAQARPWTLTAQSPTWRNSLVHAGRVVGPSAGAIKPNMFIGLSPCQPPSRLSACASRLTPIPVVALGRLQFDLRAGLAAPPVLYSSSAATCACVSGNRQVSSTATCPTSSSWSRPLLDQFSVPWVLIEAQGGKTDLRHVELVESLDNHSTLACLDDCN